MAKLKRASKKPKTSAPQRGMGCIVLLVLGLVLAMLFLIYVMGHANQT